MEIRFVFTLNLDNFTFDTVEDGEQGRIIDLYRIAEMGYSLRRYLVEEMDTPWLSQDSVYHIVQGDMTVVTMSELLNWADDVLRQMAS